MNATASMPESLDLTRIDARVDAALPALEELRRRLSPDGNIVSPRGRELTQRVFGEPLTPEQVVRRICDDVRERGSDALLHYSQQLDGGPKSPKEFRVPTEKMAEAHAAASPEFLETIRTIRANVLEFQTAILHRDVTVQPRPGVTLQQRYIPLERIGICVPGGAAAYPSTLLMTAVPAQAAGVNQIAVVAPPTDFGAHNPDILATCHELGITELYGIGGAQAVAAMAFGTREILGVDKIVGPGSLFVALAKKYVYGTVDIDSIAGPSEVVIVADQSAEPAHLAAEMLAQAEHSPGSSILITWEESILDLVQKELIAQLSKLERQQLTFDSLQSFGGMILVRDATHAIQLVNLFAPEHLQIATNNPRDLVPSIRNSGATFLGHYSPVALGDYAAGPSHVLPTGGTARWASGLSSNSFLRSSSVIEFNEDALSSIAPDVCRLANCEGLTAHANSVDIRLNQSGGE